MATGGMLLSEVSEDKRKELGLPDSGMALTVDHLGQFTPHDAAKVAGIEKGDVITSFDGRTDLKRESDLIGWAINSHQVGNRVKVTVVRGGKKLAFELPMQP
jgi:S1-C subfamily serine protease